MPFITFYITTTPPWNFLDQTLYALGKKTHQSTTFQTFECSNETLPNSSCHFWNWKAQTIQIFWHCSVSSKINHLYFCNWNLTYFEQKEPIKVKLPDFWVVGWKVLMSYLKLKVSFSLNIASLFIVMRDNSSLLF